MTDIEEQEITEKKYGFDRYVGDVDPVTKLRHGQGQYQFENKFFKYIGTYQDGAKHGPGCFLMKDSDDQDEPYGTVYEGDFIKGQITGRGKKTFKNGSEYEGEFLNGEQNGNGIMKYNNGDVYKGKWVLNVRQGEGELKKADKTIYRGIFTDHWPNGKCQISFSNGGLYSGTVVKGIMEGHGEIKQLDYTVYEGEFKQGQRDGKGKLSVQGTQYNFVSEWKEGQPVYQANQVLYIPVKRPELEDAKPDLKKKAPPPKKGAQKEEEDKEEEGKIKFTYEIKEDALPIEFDLQIVFQGEPYEDLTPPTEEEIAAQKKLAAKSKGKGPAVPEDPEIKIITPPPIIMENESGRQFEFELGRMEKIKIPKPEQDNKDEEIKENQTPESQLEEDEYEEKWVTYYFNQSQAHQKQVINSKNGVVRVRDLVFNTNEEFKMGQYQIIVRDISKSLTWNAPELTMYLTVIDPEELAAIEAAEKAAAKAPAGKKKK